MLHFAAPHVRPLWRRARLFALAALLLGPLPAMAADGQLLASSGDVRVLRADKGWTAVQPLLRGDALRAGDTLITGEDGRVQVRFADGALITLQPNSRFRIDEYRFDANGQRSFFSLLKGALRTSTGAIGKRSYDDWRLRTPTATVGVRGTEFTAEETVCEPQCAPGAPPGLRVTVTEGRVVVASRGASVEVPTGATLFVPATDVPAPVSPRAPLPQEPRRTTPRVPTPPMAPMPPAPFPPSSPLPDAAPPPAESRAPGGLGVPGGPPSPGAAILPAGLHSAAGRSLETAAHPAPRAGRPAFGVAADAPQRLAADAPREALPSVPSDPVAWTAGAPAGSDERALGESFIVTQP